MPSELPGQPIFLVYLFIKLARINYWRFRSIRYKFKHSTYIQEPLVIGRRGSVHRELNRKMLAADNGREESGKNGVSEGTQVK
jgi:hypothetical protein